MDSFILCFTTSQSSKVEGKGQTSIEDPNLVDSCDEYNNSFIFTTSLCKNGFKAMFVTVQREKVKLELNSSIK